MPKYAYDRLSAQDNNFLLWERGNVRMHIASTIVCDAGPLKQKDGGVDVDTFKRATEAYLHLVPRYRQRLHAIPFFDHCVWVDDPHFDIDYHIRHTALPKPGSHAQLKKLSARIMAQPLDRKRPLWETWNADPDIVPNLDLFTEVMRRALSRVAKESGVPLSRAPQKARAVRDAEEGEAPAPSPRTNGNGTAAAK